MTPSPSPSPSLVLTPDTPVNEVLRQWPGAMPVLNAFGVDSCCGGASSLSTAASDARVPLETLIAALEAATGSAAACRRTIGGPG